MLKQFGWFFAAASIVTALTVSTAHADSAERIFRWKLKPGETLKYRMVQEMEQNMRMGEQKSPTAISTKMTMDMDWKVDSVDDQGLINLDQVIQRMQMKVQSAQGVIMEYDSAAGKEPEGMARMIAPMLEGMLKKPIRTTFTARGELKKVKLPQGMLEGLNKGTGGQMGSLLSEDSMKQFGMMSVFPEEPIKPGKSWTQESTLKLPMLGNQALKTIFSYEGTETRDGRTLDKIGLTQSMKTEGKKQVGDVKKPEKKKEETIGFSDMESKGFLLFDNTAGHLVEVTVEGKMKMDMNIMGQKLTQDMTTKMQMSLLPAESASSPAVKEK